MRINTNISAMNTYSRLTAANNSKSGSLAKLSSGLRINRAGDDAAGLAISEKMRGQIGGLKQATRNAQDAISLIQTAEGGLNETHSILQRMRELAVQSSNDTNTNSDRGEIQKEIVQLSTEIDRIANNTEFNTKKLLTGNVGGTVEKNVTDTTALAKTGVADVNTSGAKAGEYTIASTGGKATMSFTDADGKTKTQEIDDAGGAQKLNFSNFGITIDTNAGFTADDLKGTKVTIKAPAADQGLTFHVGANKDQSVTLGIADMTAAGLGISGINLESQTASNAAIETINMAIETVSAERSKLGATQNRLDHTINNLTATAENLSEAESRIRDVDMAEEMMEFTKSNILSQAATSMLAQANQMPQGVLQLLQ